MTRIILSIVFALTIMQSFAQVDTEQSNDQFTQITNAVTYRLYPTKNMWTFIKLNTRNGQMWQVQYAINDDNRFETNLSSIALVPEYKEVNNRFNLYRTQNMYNFILLDQIDGRTWQVQWSIEKENRGIMPIY